MPASKEEVQRLEDTTAYQGTGVETAVSIGEAQVLASIGQTPHIGEDPRQDQTRPPMMQSWREGG